jgi:L-aminopeptidase/D-esterase-like protein
MAATGKNNALTDIQGLLVGNYTSLTAVCGVTAVLCPEGAVAGVDVRGSAPGTREIDLLAPTNLVEKVQAVVLSGGSVFGLASADGVVRWLAEKGWGFPLEKGFVAPIVPAAVLYDLGRGPDFVPPIDADWGRRACESATEGIFETGSVGAGTGAFSWSIKGGLGTASLRMDSGITVAALVAVNSDGSVVDPRTGRPWEAALERDGEFGDLGRRAVRMPPKPAGGPAQHTTIGIVATDAALTVAQAQKVAQMAHDGMARAIRPSHTMFDGDTLFCLSTGREKLPETPGFFMAPEAQAINDIGEAAADCLARAIIRSILAAESLAGMTAFCDLEVLSP